jgi:hypothetical protein
MKTKKEVVVYHFDKKKDMKKAEEVMDKIHKTKGGKR